MSPTKQKNSSTPCWVHPGSDHVDAKARRVHQGGDPYAPVVDRLGLAEAIWGMRRPTSPGCA